jgi:hypothetical protein
MLRKTVMSCHKSKVGNFRLMTGELMTKFLVINITYMVFYDT